DAAVTDLAPRTLTPALARRRSNARAEADSPPLTAGGSSASVPAAAAGRERGKRERVGEGGLSGPDRCMCTPLRERRAVGAPRVESVRRLEDPPPLPTPSPSGLRGAAEAPRGQRGPERRRRRSPCGVERRREAGAARAACRARVCERSARGSRDR